MRFLCLLGALARTIRGGYIIRVFVVFLHSEIENKATSSQSQEIFSDFGHTKVTVGFNWRLYPDDISDQRVLKLKYAALSRTC